MLKPLLKYYITIFSFICLNFTSLNVLAQDNADDSIPVRIGQNIEKPIYSNEKKKHSSFYTWAWGKHYRDVYYKPITAKAASLDSSYGGLSIISERPMLHAFILKNKRDQLFMLKPLGGSSSFLESKFFRDVYHHEDFKDTYLDDFITEAYTIVHPYMFLVSEKLARSANICSMNTRIYYMLDDGTDTIIDDNQLKNKLVSISELPALKNKKILTNVETLIDSLHSTNPTSVDQDLYIKMRLFDMLIGDWNKVSENWYWVSTPKGDSVVYQPQVIDRSHAFSKVDGFLFKGLLGMLGVGFITNYEAHIKNIKKINTLAQPLDIAITQRSTAEDWQEQARILKLDLTDRDIDNAFSALPKEMQNEDINKLKERLKARRKNLEDIALKYYTTLQKNPVITGTDRNEKFVIDQNGKELHIRIFDKNTNKLTFDKKYSPKRTKEIWLYGLGGEDSFEVNKRRRNIAILLIGGNDNNDYDVKQGNNVFIYESKSEKEQLKAINNAKVIIPNDESALEYDYQRLRHTSLSVTPIGIYDSDLGLNLGTSFSYTVYGFRRAPYTRRHQISYDLNNGFIYQGIFPSYDEKKSLHVLALVGSPSYFSNFFGFGNNTDGYKNKNKNYNRVNIKKYMLKPSLYYNINKDQTFNIYASIESYQVKNPKNRDRFINTFYDDGNSIFSTKYFVDLGAAYEFNKKMQSFVSSVKFSVSSGWTVNVTKPQNNFAYTTAEFGLNLKLTDRITFATLLKGKSLFSDKYDFFQAATTELRGYRSNRFIGRHSFYQYSDIRLDMGRLNNPLTPLNYGVFVGVDHGRVWYPDDVSQKWHSSYGGGFWLTLLRKFTGKFSYFGSSDANRLMFELGMGF